MADYGAVPTASAHDSTRSNSPPPTKGSTTRSIRSLMSSRSSESTPLLARRDSEELEAAQPHSPAASSLLRSINGSASPSGKKSSRRWPSFIALILLCLFTITIMLMGFFVPQVMEEYAMQAKEFEVTSISLPEFTTGGARARIQGVFSLDAGKVHKKYVRDLGVFGTWIAGAVESEESTVKVSLPEYGGIVLGTATVPPIVVNLRNGQKTEVDFLADLTPGDVNGIRKIADDWVSGRLGQLRVLGEADVKLKSGILSLGKQAISQSLVLAGDEIPKMPAFNITRLNFHEVELPGGAKGMAADVSIWVKNDYPIAITVPPLGFSILVDGCQSSEPHIMVADSLTNALDIQPKQDVNLNVSGTIRQLPDKLVDACPGSGKSPLDTFVGAYIHGEESTIYVRGSDSPSLDTPQWLSDIMASITVPVPFRGHTFDKLIRDFSLTNVKFNLPDPWAEPDSPESNPLISATIKALINLPQEMNFPVDVNHVRAKANVFYKGQKLGRLDLHKWQDANSTRVPANGGEMPGLLVESNINNAPLIITNDDVFSDIVQKLLFGGKPVMLTIKADVDVEMETALGVLTIREIPAEGEVPVKPLTGGDGPGGGLTSFSPKIGNLMILDTTTDGLTLQAQVNFTNPTAYSAVVPYVDIKVLTNGTLLGHVTAQNISVVPGNNTDIVVQAVWEPAVAGGAKGKAVGRELLSQYLSGYNTTLSLRTHKGTIPCQPALGKALEAFTITIPTPRMSYPKPTPPDGDDPEDPSDPPEDDGKPHFIQEATMHLFSSTANFVLLSPLSKTTLYITKINATAFYKDDDVGKIEYELPFAVTPGQSTTPRLPVQWSLGSVGYEAVRKAIGGTLRLSAKAEVGIRIGLYDVAVWFQGGGIGAKVRI